MPTVRGTLLQSILIPERVAPGASWKETTILGKSVTISGWGCPGFAVRGSNLRVVPIVVSLPSKGTAPQAPMNFTHLGTWIGAETTWVFCWVQARWTVAHSGPAAFRASWIAFVS